MLPSVVFTFILGLLFGVARADFYIYHFHLFRSTFEPVAEGFVFFHEQDLPVDCNGFKSIKEQYPISKDVSRRKGVACDGDGCSYLNNIWYDGISRLEFHTRWGHYTWYKNRDMRIVDLNDRVVGTCEFNQGGLVEMYCKKSIWNEVPREFKVRLAFKCNTTIW
ncbi:hypothetical protein QBC34DRAFT_461172 [Podospora aff. communis PSN243]|uniref:Cyanovirin-N domain-containing protein n=1 Tax=Podospora aff. communis PSN243 TaxID=3040156 RepID=A0AAV9GPL5_9PEZI|nr:hypothetical protein QBC34DRAFT_461172 [Podospora aff. communis PSN243]